MNINWDDPRCQISLHFRVNEALWLPSWNRLANESDGLNDEIKSNILTHALKMEDVRNILGPMVVHCWYRPPTYNKLVGGAPGSAHMKGLAVDYHCINQGIEESKNLILNNNLLETLGLRMEKGTTNWIHNDSAPVPTGGNRYFLP